MSDRLYYSITTRKFILRTSHDGWLLATRKLYNEVLYFYYRLFLEHSELYALGNQKALRELERMTIVGRDKQPVEEPLPWKGFPLYLRRAAINAALSAGRSYLARDKQAFPSETFSASINLYKGNYKNLDSRSITIKVWNGEKWQWLKCRLYRNHLPEDGICLSPRVVFKANGMELHVPVQQTVPNGKPLRERMGSELRICSLQFTNGDTFAVACILNRENELEAARFFRGGKTYAARYNRILDKIKKSREAVGNEFRTSADSESAGRNNKRYWKKLKCLREDTAHQISRRIVDFCRESGAQVIVLPKYSREFSKYVMISVGDGSPLRLNDKVRTLLRYKAWQEGILVIESEVSDIGRYCALCKAAVHIKGELFICENGHQGNRRINAAKNLGRKTYENLDRHMQ